MGGGKVSEVGDMDGVGVPVYVNLCGWRLRSAIFIPT